MVKETCTWLNETLHQTQTDPKFRQLLLESLDEGLSNVFSESMSKTLFSIMETRFSVKRQDIPERIGAFENHMMIVFGAAAPVLIRVFVRNLCAKLEIPYHQMGCNFEQYLEDCMRRWKEKEGIRSGSA